MFKPLSAFQKFQSGSDLWILFYEPRRKLFKRINWRLGFLLEEIKNQKEFSEPALIDTHTALPNRILVCLPFHKKSWPDDTYKNWARLKKPSLRVFPPLKADEEELPQAWPQEDLSHSLSYFAEKKK